MKLSLSSNFQTLFVIVLQNLTMQCPQSCLIHVCHKFFQAGLKKYRSDAEELVLNLYYFITKSPARRLDLFEIEETLGLNDLVLLHHVQSLVFGVPSVQHVMSMKAALVKLFADEFPKNDKNITHNDKYLTIRHTLESKEVSSNVFFDKYEANL